MKLNLINAPLIAIYLQVAYSFSPNYKVINSYRHCLQHRVIFSLFSTENHIETTSTTDTNDIEAERRILQRKIDVVNKQSRNKREGLNGLTTDFVVPGFVAIWALGYSAIAYYETQGEGFGEVGGAVSVVFTCVLLFFLVGAALFEVLKPDVNDEYSK
jgi:hypothetical protein